MPILDIQRRFRELGRIRMGDRTDRGAPRKLGAFRLTSSSRELLEAAAAQHGGTVRPWQGAPTEGQWEVYLEADRLPVVVPPGQVLSQWYEQWTGGGCARRCDGQTEQIGDTPCLCPDDPAERRELAQDGKACRITTRISVMLPDLPDIGVWRLESHGFYAATELAGTMALLDRATAQGVLLPAQLRIEQRVTKKPNNGGTLRYIVPVLDLPETTAREFIASMGLGLPARAELPAPEPVRPALAPPPATPEEAAPETGPLPTSSTLPPPDDSPPTWTDQLRLAGVARGWNSERLRAWLQAEGYLTESGRVKRAALDALLALPPEGAPTAQPALV